MDRILPSKWIRIVSFRKLSFFLLGFISGTVINLLKSKVIFNNFPIKSVATVDVHQNETDFRLAFIDKSGLLKSILSPNLQWCSKNPFLQSYDQNLILNFEIQWINWNGNLLSEAHEILKDFALHGTGSIKNMAGLAYPSSLPFPCSFKNNLTRIGGTGDGSKILCGIEYLAKDSSCIVYSLGSRRNFQFELDLLNRTTCEIFTYDCTSSPSTISINRLTFKKICLGDEVQLQKFMYPYVFKPLPASFLNASNFRSFLRILKENNHNEVHILKMDIEGGEYAVFSDLLKQRPIPINLPYQISFESHWWDADIYHAILQQHMFSQLWKFGYRFVHHEQNPADLACFEWTLIRVFC